MALKDLKSDLSKFRKPVEKPLIEQKRVEVPKSSNQTPLSQFVDSAPDAPKSQTTTPKQGVTPNKFDNSSKFMGETTPSQFDNSSNYLGETTPSQMSLKERFLGQTEPNTVQQGDKFKGETETANITQGDRFKGQTTPQDYSNAEKFKGETSPTEFKFVKQFLGETTPTDTSLTAKFLGETTPNVMDLEAKFLGETNVPDVVLESPFKGETTPDKFTFNPKLDLQATEPKFVDFITNDDAKGFSPFQKPKDNSTFVGVDPSQTQFDGVTPISGQFVLNQYGVDTQNDSGLGTFYSNKILKTTYNKFNLKEDSYNSSIFKQPFILSGIQREKGEPQTLGLGSFSFIRGGAVTSTQRAAIDVVRMGQFLLTPRGVTWILKQVGMQRSQRWGKTFTPVNLVGNLATQHLGLRFDRPGVQPLGDETWKYQAGKPTAFTLASEGTVSPGKIKNIYNQLDLTVEGTPFAESTDVRGGFDSFYGIGITTTTRGVNTFGGTRPSSIGLTNYGDYFKQNKEGKLVNVNTPENIDKKNKQNKALQIGDGPTKKLGNDIKDYLMMDYQTVNKIANGKSEKYKGDFRNDKITYLFDGYGINKQDYTNYNLEKTYGIPSTFKTNAERVDPNNRKLRIDNVYDSVFNAKLQNDLVHLFFAYDTSGGAQNGEKTIQFRSTISGVTETFSPSWNGIKYPGRADKAYMYSEFERTLSFTFKAYATSREEMKNMWKKLSELSKLTMPTYGGSAYSGHICYFRLGQLWGNGTSGVPSLITSLTYTIPDDLSWDLNHDGKLAELPMGVDVNIGLTLLPTTIYKSSKNHYSFYGTKAFSNGTANTTTNTGRRSSTTTNTGRRSSGAASQASDFAKNLFK